MPEHADLTDHGPAGHEPDSPSSSAAEPAGGRPAEMSETAASSGPMVSVSELTAHPGNVREDLELTTEFCASIAAEGVRVPLIITTSDGGYRVIEGHRRLAAAARASLDQVPCVVDPSRSGDEAGQYLDMLLANSGAYRRNFAAVEEAAALFAAHQAGATRTRLRKATGRKAEDIRTALKAGQLSAQARESVGDLARQLDLEELALLAEFDGDPGAISQLLDARERGYGMEYTAERIRRGRARAHGGRAEGGRLPDHRRCPPWRGAAVAAASRRGMPHSRRSRHLPRPRRVLPALGHAGPGALLRQPARARPRPAQPSHRSRRRERRWRRRR
jgi:hypothetical protein